MKIDFVFIKQLNILVMMYHDKKARYKLLVRAVMHSNKRYNIVKRAKIDRLIKTEVSELTSFLIK